MKTVRFFAFVEREEERNSERVVGYFSRDSQGEMRSVFRGYNEAAHNKFFLWRLKSE